MIMSTKTVSAIALMCTTALSTPAFAHDEKAMSKGSKEIHEEMMDSAKKSQSMNMEDMSGDTDKDFAMMMADHHRSAIKMAKSEIENGKNPELKQLAQNIIDSQQKEIATLEKHASMKH